jgi:hypothetical protein
MLEHHISDALQSSVTVAVQASSNSSFPIKMLGRTFTPPNDGKWLELVQLPNNMVEQYWGDETIYRGILRLLFHYPNDNNGAIEPLKFVDEVASWFSKDKFIAAGNVIVKIQEKPDLTGVIEAGKELIFPVSIRYQSYSTT